MRSKRRDSIKNAAQFVGGVALLGFMLLSVYVLMFFMMGPD